MTDGTPQLVRDLLRAGSFGPAAPEISLRSTHASWVFLAGGDAWKVKRPIELGFLDFRTPESRRRFCEEEVRLNRRLAPDVYLGVEPIHLSTDGHGFSLSGDGPVVDWAVHMRRLPDEASAQALLDRGELTAPLLEQVAGHLAAFLRAARATPEFGAPAALAANIEENFAQVLPFVDNLDKLDLLGAAGALVDRQTLDQVRTFQVTTLARHWQRFAERVAEARIREGHGDLRLEHVYLLPSAAGARRPVIIDCIEFNERFRCGDAAAEAGFLAMELERAGRPDLGAGFIARFAEASDDFGLYGVLDLYLSYRAWVRGKVAAFVAADAGAPPDVRRRKGDEAHRQFGLARAFAGAPLDRPFLIAVGGLIGSGKSTLAAGLGRALAVPVAGSDRMRKLAAGLEPTAKGDAGLYAPEQKDRTYAEMVRRARVVLDSGRGVVLDASFSTHRWRQAAAEAARAAGAAFAFIEARAAPELLRRRLAARRPGASVSDATEELLDPFTRAYEARAERDPGPWWAVDTGGAAEAALTAALDRLAGAGILAAADRRAS